MFKMPPTVMSQVQVDMSKIQALQQKRTLAFVNHFVMTNVQFLNNFMKNCEQKLMNFERKLEKVNASMVLLEARLSSIPEVNTVQPTIDVAETAATIKTEHTNEPIEEPYKDTEPSEDKTDTTDAKTRSEYDRFVKMVQVGVPVQAVKLKVSLEGLDPNVLDEVLGK